MEQALMEEQEVEYLSIKELRDIQMGVLIPILMDAGFENVAGNYRETVVGMTYIAQFYVPEVAVQVREKVASISTRRVHNESAKPRQERKRSSVGGAVARVHEICSQNKDLERKDIIDLCVKAGINKNTAATQYAKWKKEQKA